MTKPTIYETFKAKIGREPTNAELNTEVKRIIFGSPDPRMPGLKIGYARCAKSGWR